MSSRATMDKAVRFNGLCMDCELYINLMWHPTNTKHRTRLLTEQETWIIPRLIKSLEVAVNSRAR